MISSIDHLPIVEPQYLKTLRPEKGIPPLVVFPAGLCLLAITLHFNNHAGG